MHWPDPPLEWHSRTAAEAIRRAAGRRLEPLAVTIEAEPLNKFTVLPERRVAGRTCATLVQPRSLSKDWEHLPKTSGAAIYAAVDRLIPH